MLRKSILIFLVICFLIGPLWSLCANNTSEIVQSTEERYMTILACSKQLAEELRLQRISLNEYKQKSQDLQNELATMSSDLENLQTDSKQLKQEISGLKNSIDGLLKKQQEDLKKYEALERTCQEIAETAEREIRQQKIKTVVYIILAAAAGFAIGKTL